MRGPGFFETMRRLVESIRIVAHGVVTPYEQDGNRIPLGRAAPDVKSRRSESQFGIAEGHILGILIELGLPPVGHGTHARIRTDHGDVPHQSGRQLLGETSVRERDLIPESPQGRDEIEDPSGQVGASGGADDAQRVPYHVTDSVSGLHPLRQRDQMLPVLLGELHQTTTRRDVDDRASAGLGLLAHMQRLRRIARIARDDREGARTGPMGQVGILDGDHGLRRVDVAAVRREIPADSGAADTA